VPERYSSSLYIAVKSHVGSEGEGSRGRIGTRGLESPDRLRAGHNRETDMLLVDATYDADILCTDPFVDSWCCGS
jgi:hypothetical protein